MKKIIAALKAASIDDIKLPFYLTLLGGIWVYVALVNAQQSASAVASGNWPATEGTIVRSRIERRPTTMDDPAGNRGWKEIWALSYRYSVDGKNYSGDNFDFRAGSIDQDTIDRYPIGKQVQVYYDPDNPELAVLVPGPSSRTDFGAILRVIIPMIAGIATLGVKRFGVTDRLFLRFLRARIRKKPVRH